MLFKVIRADGLVDRRAAVQILNDELAERFFLLRDDTDAALFIVVEDEVIQNDAVKVRAENA